MKVKDFSKMETVGLVRAIDCVDLIIEVLRGAKKVADAKECLMHGKTDNITFKTKTAEKQASKNSFAGLFTPISWEINTFSK